MPINGAMYAGYNSLAGGTYSSPAYSTQTYDTPGYNPGYRPAYGDSSYDPYNPWTMNTSWKNSTWNMMGVLPAPIGSFADSPAYQNANMSAQYNGQNFGTGINDRLANVAQQWILPFSAYYLGHRISRMPGGFANGGVQYVLNHFTNNQAVKLRMGARLGQAIGTGIGGAMGGAAGGALRGLTGFGGVGWGASIGGGALGTMGMVLGELAAPMAIGMGVSHIANTALFDPYIDTRRMATSMQAARANRIINGPNAAPNMGLGLSGYSATRTASAISHSAWDDMTFSNSQYSTMVDYGMQTGIYDDLGSMTKDAVVGRTRKMAADVKRIMAVFGEKDMREAVAILADFTKKGGAVGGSDVSGALSSLRMGTMMSGRGGRELYSSVGAVGAGIYAGAGMSQIAGLTNSMSVFAGMSNAQNMGLISNRMLSLFGGMDNLTASATGARAFSGSSDYNRMALYAQFFGGGTGNSMMGNVNAFAQATSRDPLSATGRMLLRTPEMMDAQARTSPTSVYAQYMQQLQMMYPTTKKFSMEQLASVMAGNGMSSDQIRAAALDISNIKRGLTPDALGRAYVDSQRQGIEAMGFSYMGPVGIAARQGLYEVGRALSPLGEGMAEDGARLGDAVAGAWQNWRFGKVQQNPLNKYFASGGKYKRLSIKMNAGWTNGGLPAKYEGIHAATNKALTGIYGSDARTAAEKVASGKGTTGDVMLIGSASGTSVTEEIASSYGTAARTNGSVEDVTIAEPDYTKMIRTGTMEKYLALGEDGDWNDAGEWIDTDGVNRPSKRRYLYSDKEKELAGSSKEVMDAYLTYIGAVQSGESAVSISEFINSLTPSVRKKLTHLIDSTGGASRDVKGIMTSMAWRASMRSGNPVLPEDVKRIVDKQVEGDKFSGVLKNATLAAITAAKVGHDKRGNLRTATGKDFTSRLSVLSALPGAPERAYGREGMTARTAAIQGAVKVDKERSFTDALDTYSSSLDGVGGAAGEKVMLTASGLFKTAVDQFTETVIYTTKNKSDAESKQLRAVQQKTNQAAIGILGG